MCRWDRWCLLCWRDVFDGSRQRVFQAKVKGAHLIIKRAATLSAHLQRNQTSHLARPHPFKNWIAKRSKRSQHLESTVAQSKSFNTIHLCSFTRCPDVVGRALPGSGATVSNVTARHGLPVSLAQ